MKRTYLIETVYKGEVKREKKILTTSLKYWLRNAKLDERDGFVIDITFKYLTKSEVIMTSYISTDLKSDCQMKVSLLSNKL